MATLVCHECGAEMTNPECPKCGPMAKPYREQLDYSIALQRVISTHCHGEVIPCERIMGCPHDAGLLNRRHFKVAKRIAELETERDGRIEEYAKRMEELDVLQKSYDAVYQQNAKLQAVAEAVNNCNHVAQQSPERNEVLVPWSAWDKLLRAAGVLEEKP